MKYIEIESTDQLREHLALRGHLRCVVVQGLDLREATPALLEAQVQGAVFLGCRLERDARQYLRDEGALLFPRLGQRPYQPFRPRLYTAAELMQGYVRGDHASFNSSTLDGQIYAHYDALRRAQGPTPVLEALAQRIHDHAIDDALQDLLSEGPQPRRVVAIMGGHAMQRQDPAYLKVAQIARLLGRGGYLVATGGGPGAMEAGNLGAYFARHEDADLQRAVTTLAQANHFDDAGYFDRAYEVLDRHPAGAENLAIPTWFYGHEPANLFASHIAKYFANSIREEGLLAMASHGVIYAPGSAGTIQEVFMDATQNHYVTFGKVSPMVFFGVDYWTHKKPVYPLLRSLAAGRAYGEMLGIYDEVEQVVEFIERHPPI